MDPSAEMYKSDYSELRNALGDTSSNSTRMDGHPQQNRSFRDDGIVDSRQHEAQTSAEPATDQSHVEQSNTQPTTNLDSSTGPSNAIVTHQRLLSETETARKAIEEERDQWRARCIQVEQELQELKSTKRSLGPHFYRRLCNSLLALDNLIFPLVSKLAKFAWTIPDRYLQCQSRTADLGQQQQMLTVPPPSHHGRSYSVGPPSLPSAESSNAPPPILFSPSRNAPSFGDAYQSRRSSDTSNSNWNGIPVSPTTAEFFRLTTLLDGTANPSQTSTLSGTRDMYASSSSVHSPSYRWITQDYPPLGNFRFPATGRGPTSVNTDTIPGQNPTLPSAPPTASYEAFPKYDDTAPMNEQTSRGGPSVIVSHVASLSAPPAYPSFPGGIFPAALPGPDDLYTNANSWATQGPYPLPEADDTQNREYHPDFFESSMSPSR
ncbi:hypothetical protein PLICRDRAFT_176718 [Plicaturopsis crispa FD-325 SS-3]|nr:hypothetical protein PLICRDRAFT_176718 [Plicaturopsis crispa FD-325 SS-3]